MGKNIVVGFYKKINLERYIKGGECWDVLIIERFIILEEGNLLGFVSKNRRY